jgi:cysteinyl-tRNA synthetase
MESSENMEGFYLLLKEIDTRLRSLPLDKPVRRPVEKISPDEKNGLDPLLNFPSRFEEAMDDDFNTALAIGCFHEMARVLNRILRHPGDDPTLDLSLLAYGKECMTTQGPVLGLFQSDPEGYLDHKKQERLKTASLKEKEITRLVEERTTARKAKNWSRADEIRDYLASHNILLEDGPGGTRWRIKD